MKRLTINLSDDLYDEVEKEQMNLARLDPVFVLWQLVNIWIKKKNA